MKRIYIVNPKYGKGKAIKVMQKIKNICDIENYDYQIIETNKPKHATTISSQFYDDIVFSVVATGL